MALIYSQTMENAPPDQPEHDDIDPALVDAMRERVVVRKTQDYGKRKAGPGRPKGSGKPAGSGRKAGTPNVLTPEFRLWLADRAKPFEVLAAICAGEEIADGGTKRKPTVAERMRAAETLARKLLPDLAATTITGANGGPVSVSESSVTPVELARRVAFMLAQGVDDAQEASRAYTAPTAPTHDTVPVAVNDAAPTIDHEPQAVSGYEISFAESLPGDRERWAIRDRAGRLVGTAFGREAAAIKAMNLQGEGSK